MRRRLVRLSAHSKKHMKKIVLKLIPFSGHLLFSSVSDMAVRWWRERIIGLCLALVALGAYWWTLCPSVLPGASALASLGSLHTGSGCGVVGHPIGNIASHFFSLLPVGEIPWRLNLFSALCGAGAIFFLFRLVTLILYDVMSEERWIEQIDEDMHPTSLSNEVAASTGGMTDIINEKGHRIAMAGGAVSAMSFTFCAPFWLASTSLHFQTFELFLLLAAGYTLTRYWATSYTAYAVIAAFLLGFGVLESAYFLALLPVGLLCLFFGGYRHGHISAAFMGLLVLSLAVGGIMSGAAQVGWLIHGGSGTRDIDKIVSIWVQGHGDGLRSMFTHTGCLIMLAQGILPLLIIYSGRNHFVNTNLLNPLMEDAKEYTDPDSEEHHVRLSGLFWGIVLLLLLGCVAHTLLNLPGSPWYFSRENAYLPVMPLLGVAMAFGFLFSFVLLISHGRLVNFVKNKDGALSSHHSGMARVMSAGMIIVTCSLIGATVLRNRDELAGQKAVFVDQFCREILNAAPEASCFVTDGTFDADLYVQARLLKREITLLNIRDSSHWHLSSIEGVGVKRQTATEFLIEWIVANPNACSQIAVLTAPRLWSAAGIQAIPNRLVYLGTKPDAKLDLKLLLKEHRLFWEKNKPLFVEDSQRPVLLRNLQADMLRHVSRIANDLGVLCLYQDAREQARDAFSLALDMDSNNLCAYVNQWSPDLGSSQPKKGITLDALLEKITLLQRRTPSFGSFAEYEKHYGALYLPAVEHLANLCNELPESEDSDKRCAVMRQSRDYVRAAIQASAEPRVSKQPLLKDGSIDEEVLKVVETITGGYSKAAESQLRNLLRKRRASLVAWSLLAEVLMNQGNFTEVQSTVLPEMRFIAGSKGSEWVEMTEGCLAMRQGNPDYRLAHDQFMRVFQRKPEIEEAQNLLIQTALLLGDQPLIEMDCKAVMERSPDHPMANAAFGALRLNQGRLEEAEKALNVSIMFKPSSLALNDLGEALRRRQRFHTAEWLTRRALILNPGFYQAWDTLALILRDQKRLDEAAEAHRRALRLCQTDIRLYLSAAQLEQIRGDLNAVSALCQQAAPLLAHSATPDKERYNALAKGLPQTNREMDK